MSHSRRCRDITDACIDHHCLGCGAVVPTGTRWCCGECGHAWRTGLGLLLAHWRTHLGIVWKDWRDPAFGRIVGPWELGSAEDWPPVRWWHLFGVFRCWRPSLVWVCPCCSHDL